MRNKKTDRKIEAALLMLALLILLSPSLVSASIIEGFSQIRFSSDLSFNGTTLNFYTSNQSRIFINEGGLIGFGIQNPQYQLQVGLADKAINVSNVLFVNGTSSNVGIGTSNPTERLVVIGKVNISDSLNVSGTIQAGRFVGDGSGLTGISASGGSSPFNSSGNRVFLNDSTSTLDLAGNLIVQGNTINATGSIFSQGINLTALNGQSNGGFTDDGSVVRLTGAGDLVGIGTSSPTEKLAVSGNASFSGDVVITGNVIAGGQQGASSYLSGFIDDGGIVRLVSSTDLVGIGVVNPESTLHINGTGPSAGLRVTNQSGSNTFFVNSSNGRVQFSSLISCDTIDTDSSGALSCGTDSSGGVGGSTFNNENFTILYDARTDRFLIANYTALQNAAFQNSNFSTLYDTRADRFTNANFTAQLAAASVTTNQFNSSGNSVFLNDSTASLGIRTRPTGNVALEVAGKINATYLNITGRDQNATFMGDVQIMGTLYGGSPVKISGGLNVSGVATGQDAIFVTNASGDKIIKITNTGVVNVSTGAGNTTFDDNTLFVDITNNRVGIGTTIPSTALQVAGTITATSFVGDGTGLSGVGGSFTNRSDINVTNFVANNTLFVNGSKVGIGSQPDQILGVSTSPRLQVHGTSFDTSSIGTGAWTGTTSNFASNIILFRSRGTSVGDFTSVASGDRLGQITFNGANGTDTKLSVSIRAEVDASTSAGFIPGRLLFLTSDSAGTANEQMRIDSFGRVGIGQTSPNVTLGVSGSANITGTISFPSLANCDTIDTNGAGQLTCGTDNSAGTLTGTAINVTSINASANIQLSGGNLLLDNARRIEMKNSSENYSQVLRINSGNLVILRDAGNKDAMTIDPNGKIGIGTVSPTDKLTVVGTVNATNFTLATVCADGEVLKFQNGFAVCGTDSAGSGGIEGTDDAVKTNILLNTLRVQDANSIPVVYVQDGFVDKFKDESGVDLPLSIGELYNSSEAFYTNLSGNMSLVSSNFTAKSTQNSATILILLEEINATTLNTDIVASISATNGNSWTEVTLSDKGMTFVNSTVKIVKGTAQFGSAGTAMRYNISTRNGKLFRIHGVAMSWGENSTAVSGLTVSGTLTASSTLKVDGKINLTAGALYFPDGSSMSAATVGGLSAGSAINVTTLNASDTVLFSRSLIVLGRVNISSNLTIDGEIQGTYKKENDVEVIGSVSTNQGSVLLMHFNNDTSIGELYNNTFGTPDGNEKVVDSTLLNNGTTLGNISFGSSGGKFRGAFEFDGYNDVINISRSASLNGIGTKTVSAWIYLRSWGVNETPALDRNQSLTIASKNDAGASGWEFSVQSYVSNQSARRLFFRQGFSTTAGAWATPNLTIGQNQWYHVALVYDSSSTANDPLMYINGEQMLVSEIETPSGSVSSDSSNDLLIGTRKSGAALERFFNGTIDELGIWNRSLSSSEISTQYKRAFKNVIADDTLITGSLKVDQNIVLRGNLSFTTGADYAEMFESDEKLEPGDVVCLDENKKISKCESSADPNVIGAISTNPSIVGRDKFANAYPVGMIGVVPIKVIGPLKRSSLITASAVSGYAEKATIEDFGSIIGKTMDSCEEKECIVDVAVGLR